MSYFCLPMTHYGQITLLYFTTNVVRIDILCQYYPTLANHEPIQLHGRGLRVKFPAFKCLHDYANEITSVEPKVEGIAREI